MSEKRRFELGSVGELRKKYYTPGELPPIIRLDASNVPESLKALIPLAEKWGISDDILRADFIAAARPVELDELKKAVTMHNDDLEEWVIAAAKLPQLSAEFLAFTNMLMASLGC